jgi:hypothetical protein
MTVIPAFKRMRWENHEFKLAWTTMARLHLKIPTLTPQNLQGNPVLAKM